MNKKEHKLRMIFNANAPWSTSGYAVQTELLSSRVRDEGYNMALVNFYGQEGGTLRINDIVMYPKLGSQWGDDAMVYHGKDFKADISFTLQDIWTMNPDFLRQMTRWIPIVPIDHEPAPSIIVDRLRLAYRIITYSKFGQREMGKLGFYTTYIPHVVDTEVLKPMENKSELRKELGMPEDAFVIGMVGANKDNPPRKSFQEVIDAFAIFVKSHPKAVMFFHTLLQQQGGFPIETYWNFIGLPKNKLFFIQPYDLMFHVGRKELAKIYNTFDILVAPSTNEGFGVPIIEAQSCGVPVITNNFTSMPELIIPGKTGYLCEVGWKRFDAIGSYIGHPSTTSLVEQLEKIIRADRKQMGVDARNWILENYDANTVYKEKWSPFLQRLEDEIYEAV